MYSTAPKPPAPDSANTVPLAGIYLSSRYIRLVLNFVASSESFFSLFEFFPLYVRHEFVKTAVFNFHKTCVSDVV